MLVKTPSSARLKEVAGSHIDTVEVILEVFLSGVSAISSDRRAVKFLKAASIADKKFLCDQSSSAQPQRGQRDK